MSPFAGTCLKSNATEAWPREAELLTAHGGLR